MKKKKFRRCLSHVPMKRLLVMLLSFGFIVPLFAQQIDISGTITEGSTGDPLPGVNVFVEGTTSGTITDANGKYSITAQQDAVLVFSYVGYNTERISVDGQSTIDVMLISDIETLNEIVVIGYGTQRKEAVTGSVATMRGDDIREVASGDVTHALQGRIPGVDMQQTSSKPGSSMQIRIRGTRSLSAENGPLIVLDGIPFAGELTDIDMSDIKSVDILKDASATAIYGSRGANGVILITSNKGYKGQAAQVSYNSYYGIKQAIKYPMMSGDELAALRDTAGLYQVDGTDEVRGVNTDWQDLFYRPGTITNHDLKVSGGTENGTYNFGVGYFLDQAVIPTQQFQRFSLRAALDQAIGKYFHFGFTSNNNYSLTEGTQVGQYGILAMSPMIDPYNADGTVKRTAMMPLDESYVLTRDKVNDLSDEWLSETKAYGTYNNLYGELEIPGVKGLKYRANIGLNLRYSKYGGFTGQGVNNTNPDAASSASIDEKTTTNWVIENLLTYDRTFADKHQINLVALYSAEENLDTRFYARAQDIPNPDFQYYNLGAALGEVTIPNTRDPQGNPYQDYRLSALQSWMGRAMYSYDSRYMLTVAVRRDGSSRLAPGYKWHTYPAISVGWNIGSESFLESITAINMLKLRVGYGQTSNQAVDPYSTLGLLSPRPYNFGSSTFATGYYVNQIANEELGWEYSETYNYGVDFSLFGSRLNGTLEYYTTYTNDILLNLSLPSTAGVSGYTANIGETRNKGIELSLNGTIIENFNGFTWDAGINIYSNKNELVALASGQEEDKANWWFVGHPINVIYDHNRIGIWAENDPYREDLESGSSTVGMIKVQYYGEYEEDGTPSRRIGADDRIPIQVDPKFQGGFNTRLAYKGFDLTAVGAFQNGGTLVSTLYAANGYLNMLSGRRNNVKVDYWTPDNTDTRFPHPASKKSGDNPAYGSTLGYFDGSFLKIRSLTLGYNFTSLAWAKNAGISKLRVYLSAQNVLTLFSEFHKESGLDPQTNSYGDENSAVRAYPRRILTVGVNTPSTKNYLIGINVTF